MIHPALDAHSLTLPVALMRPRYVTELLSCGGSVVATAMARAMATAVAPLLSALGQRCGCEVAVLWSRLTIHGVEAGYGGYALAVGLSNTLGKFTANLCRLYMPSAHNAQRSTTHETT